MNLYLLSPVLLCETRIGRGGPDHTLLFILPASLLTLLAAQLVLRPFWVTHLLLFPFYVLVAVDLYVIAEYGTRLDSSTLLVILDNLDGTADFVRGNLRSLVLSLSLLLGGYIFGLSRLRPLSMTAPRIVLVGTLVLTALLYVGVKRRIGLLVHLAAADRSSPFGVLPQAWVMTLVRHENLEQERASRSFSFHARRADPPAQPEAYVLVIGESSRPDHWGVYGYSRDTTPLLSQERGLVLFRDAIAQVALTRVSVPLLLTRGALEDPELHAEEKSLVSAYREAGFHTFWLSTQQRDPFTGAINRFSAEADVQRFYARRFDGILADQAARILADPAEKKVLLVVHGMGNHYFYENRYPPADARFPTQGPRLTRRDVLVNAYDNTVAYEDEVLDTIIGSLKHRPGLAALLFVSDHGDNLEDDARGLVGHFHNNEFDLPIPLFFWMSDAYQQHYPGRVGALEANTLAPINTRVVFYSLLDLAGISIGDATAARLSLFSKDLAVGPRFVQRTLRPVNFDQWLAASQVTATGFAPAITEGKLVEPESGGARVTR